jgi:hypothetical protein
LIGAKILVGVFFFEPLEPQVGAFTIRNGEVKSGFVSFIFTPGVGGDDLGGFLSRFRFRLRLWLRLGALRLCRGLLPRHGRRGWGLLWGLPGLGRRGRLELMLPRLLLNGFRFFRGRFFGLLTQFFSEFAEIKL